MDKITYRTNNHDIAVSMGGKKVGKIRYYAKHSGFAYRPSGRGAARGHIFTTITAVKASIEGK